MTTENKIKCVLMDFEINKITLQEATEQILLLLNVVGQSEQLCQYKNCNEKHYMYGYCKHHLAQQDL